ncbi:MAG: hypothetical protein IT459_05120 [Planctomycetes bacterium]|nr:hypothetical protein [Planctomycetota bacterium]
MDFVARGFVCHEPHAEIRIGEDSIDGGVRANGSSGAVTWTRLTMDEPEERDDRVADGDPRGRSEIRIGELVSNIRAAHVRRTWFRRSAGVEDATGSGRAELGTDDLTDERPIVEQAQPTLSVDVPVGNRRFELSFVRLEPVRSKRAMNQRARARASRSVPVVASA